MKAVYGATTGGVLFGRGSLLEISHEADEKVLKEWLKRKLTIREAEERHLVYHEQLGNKGVPFGFLNAEWRELVARMLDGDEIWEFSSPANTWSKLGGRAGVALVRNGEIIDSIITRMN